jgi:hypothetical protein
VQKNDYRSVKDLKKIGMVREKRKMITQPEKENRTDEIRIADATFPAPFAPGLEFNAPVHGTWNIVHIGMQIPEAVQIYVCAQNCMRGVVLTAAEMNASERFSYVILTEKDMVSGDIEDITICGVTDVIQKRNPKPKAVLLFTVCAHHFLGCDYNRIYRELESRFPKIDFFRCYMDPIMQKKGLTPDQKLRRATYEKLPELPVNEQKLALLGSDFLIGEDSELVQLVQKSGSKVVQIKGCTTYEDFLHLSEGKAFLCIYPPAKVGVEQAAKRLNRPFFYLPASFDYGLIEAQLTEMAEFLQMEPMDIQTQRQAAEAALCEAKRIIGDTPVAIDYTVHPRTLGLARLLLAHGFCVDRVYIDSVNREEEADFLWLKEHAPQLILSATVHVKKRVTARGRGVQSAQVPEPCPSDNNTDSRKVLAIGQKAAWFERTEFFVNLVSGGDLYGFSGVRRMAELMVEAFQAPKDTEDIVPRKGWGCESCI